MYIYSYLYIHKHICIHACARACKCVCEMEKSSRLSLQHGDASCRAKPLKERQGNLAASPPRSPSADVRKRLVPADSFLTRDLTPAEWMDRWLNDTISNSPVNLKLSHGVIYDYI